MCDQNGLECMVDPVDRWWFKNLSKSGNLKLQDVCKRCYIDSTLVGFCGSVVVQKSE